MKVRNIARRDNATKYWVAGAKQERIADAAWQKATKYQRKFIEKMRLTDPARVAAAEEFANSVVYNFG
jgi:hypothetical protein